MEAGQRRPGRSSMKHIFVIAGITGVLSCSLQAAETLPSFKVQKVNLSTADARQTSLVDVDAHQQCLRIANKLGSVRTSDCKSPYDFVTEGLSVRKLPIIVREYPPLKKLPRGRILMLGGIHGDEYSSVSIMFHWMRTLNEHHSGLFHWKVIPLVNPDGLLRKKSQRMNENGVDLNRNFPTPNWQAESREYWEKRTHKNPRRYPGPYPLSEPESQWLAKEIERFAPDVIVAVHAPYGILDFDGPHNDAPKRLGHLHLNVLGTYPGSLGNFAGIQQSIPVVTIELPYAGIMPTQGQVATIWRDLVVWLKKSTSENRRQALAATQDADPS